MRVSFQYIVNNRQKTIQKAENVLHLKDYEEKNLLMMEKRFNFAR